MPKRSGSARGGAQRNRPKVQKNIELVRQSAPRERSSEVSAAQEDTELAAVSTATVTTSEPETQKTSESVAPAPEVEKISEKLASAPVQEVQKTNGKAAVPAAKGSASARLAARRQGGARSQRNAATLITAEHFTYVRRDLITIGILAGIMVVAMIILYFVLVVNGLF
ncbi:MAG TPA: hypothetical protein VKV37_20625 [Ktedonobacteraceae bacterium]|jgi:CCR4-NOT transcriptional regulation complex NOT5 subunit|nr:hypothetical protein [Ktedonobacteraceae bacterium]